MADVEEVSHGGTMGKLQGRLEKYVGAAAAAFLVFALEVIQIVVIAALIIWPIRAYLVKPFYVRGASMEPTFSDKQYFLIDEITYRFHEPKRGDVVVFKYPLNTDEFFIKRIVGMPGDRISVANGKVIISNAERSDGVILDEEYTAFAHTSGNEDITLNPDEYFVMGDNRSASLDSRNFGPVNEQFLVGKVWLRGWPLDMISTFDNPEYGF